MSELQRTDKEIALESYNAVVDGAVLSDIRLVDLDFKVKPSYFIDEGKNKKASFDSEIFNVVYDAESLTLGGMIIWKVLIENGRKKLLSAKAVYAVVYESVPPVEYVHSEAFFRKVGKFASYPYFRSTVSQLSWASGSELPIMPVLK